MGKQSYKIVSEEFCSNCMIEALKAKIRNRNVKIYFCKPRITENVHFQMFHLCGQTERQIMIFLI